MLVVNVSLSQCHKEKCVFLDEKSDSDLDVRVLYNKVKWTAFRQCGAIFYTIIHTSVVAKLLSNALNFNGVFMSCERDCRDGRYVYHTHTTFTSLHNLKQLKVKNDVH